MKKETGFLIFIKQPRPGEVKTRLGEAIGDRASAELYRDFVETSLRRFQRIAYANCTAYYHPPEEERFFRDWLGGGVKYEPQCEGDLGVRLMHGFERMLTRYHRVIALGTDSPDLPLDYLEKACSSLDEHDIVFGPAEDGGYYLVGMTAPHPGIFEGIEWSSDRVLSQSLHRCESLGLSVAHTPLWYDIDRLEDLNRLCQSRDEDVLQMLARHSNSLDKLSADYSA
ncbi:MAG: DUF2064 domain-containing protein [bacterium]|nr:DUF2064 domain-containing protein [bacterium]